jgi:hypothetical protein
MRNIATAAELAVQRGSDWRVIFALPASDQPQSVIEIEAIRKLLNPRNGRRVLILDYRALAGRLAVLEDRAAVGLAAHMRERLDARSHGRTRAHRPGTA